jgi:hypothetical protein
MPGLFLCRNQKITKIQPKNLAIQKRSRVHLDFVYFYLSLSYYHIKFLTFLFYIKEVIVPWSFSFLFFLFIVYFTDIQIE